MKVKKMSRVEAVMQPFRPLSQPSHASQVLGTLTVTFVYRTHVISSDEWAWYCGTHQRPLKALTNDLFSDLAMRRKVNAKAALGEDEPEHRRRVIAAREQRRKLARAAGAEPARKRARKTAGADAEAEEAPPRLMSPEELLGSGAGGSSGGAGAGTPPRRRGQGQAGEAEDEGQLVTPPAPAAGHKRKLHSADGPGLGHGKLPVARKLQYDEAPRKPITSRVAAVKQAASAAAAAESSSQKRPVADSFREAQEKKSVLTRLFESSTGFDADGASQSPVAPRRRASATGAASASSAETVANADADADADADAEAETSVREAAEALAAASALTRSRGFQDTSRTASARPRSSMRV